MEAGLARTQNSARSGRTLGAAIGVVALLVCAAFAWFEMRRNSSTSEARLAAKSSAVGELAAPTLASERTSVHAPQTQGPPAPEPTLSVRVVSRSTVDWKAQLAPSIEFELGAGSPFDPNAPKLAEGTTDANGEARVAIPWSAIEAARANSAKSLWVRAIGAGMQRRPNFVGLPKTATPIEIGCSANAGATLYGRLFDANDRPAAGSVRVASSIDRIGKSDEARWNVEPDGWFELDVASEGVYQITAESATSSDVYAHYGSKSGALGTAALRDVSIGAKSPPIELRLFGPGSLRGRVRDADGRALGGLSITALVASVDDPGANPFRHQPEAGALALEGRGSIAASGSTAADGTFEFAGLRLDDFVIRASAKTYGDFPRLLTHSPVRSDGGELLELVFQRPHLAVCIVDASGAIWNGVADVQKYSNDAPRDRWPSQPQLVVVPEQRDVARAIRGRALLAGSRAPNGEYLFEVDAERRYLVGLIGGAQAWQPIEVDVPKDADRVAVTVTANPSAPMGALAISVLDRDGVARRSGFHLRIEEPKSGTPLLQLEAFSIGMWPARIELPVGDYRVVAEGETGSDDWHGRVMSERELGRSEVLARVVRDTDSPVELALSGGARIHLALAGQANADDLAALRSESAYADDEYVAFCSKRARITLLSDSHWPIPVEFVVYLSAGSATGNHALDSLDLGNSMLSTVVPVGDFELEARLPGGRVRSTKVHLVEGATLDVDFDFE